MIEQKTLVEIATKIEQHQLDDNIVSILRQSYPTMLFTYCSDDDIPNHSPVIEKKDFNLYLVDNREHCLCLTNDFEVASGVVIAEIFPE